MKVLLGKHYDSYLEIKKWSKVVSVTSIVQISIQAVGLISGIYVIRFLDTDQYAYYTIANTMLGTMNVLSDGGIASSVMAIGGKKWTDKVELGKVVVDGLDLRKKFAIGAMVLTIPFMIYTLLDHNASITTTILVVASIIPTFLLALSGTLLEVPLKLHQEIIPLQRIQLISNIGRLVLLFVFVFVAPFAYIAIFVNAIPQFWANINLRKKAKRYSDFNQKPDPQVRKEIFQLVKRTLPGNIYYAFSAQISIWLISFFGSTLAIAQVGALGRITMFLNIFTMIFTIIVVPRFARLPVDSKLVLSYFYKVVALLFGIIILIILGVYLFENQILWVLGTKYTNLNVELMLATIANCISLLIGIILAISLARSWIINPYINIGLNLVIQIVLFLLLDLSNLKNVLLFSLYNNLIVLVFVFIYFVVQAKKANTNPTILNPT